MSENECTRLTLLRKFFTLLSASTRNGEREKRGNDDKNTRPGECPSAKPYPISPTLPEPARGRDTRNPLDRNDRAVRRSSIRRGEAKIPAPRLVLQHQEHSQWTFVSSVAGISAEAGRQMGARCKVGRFLPL